MNDLKNIIEEEVNDVVDLLEVYQISRDRPGQAGSFGAALTPSGALRGAGTRLRSANDRSQGRRRNWRFYLEPLRARMGKVRIALNLACAIRRCLPHYSLVK